MKKWFRNIAAGVAIFFAGAYFGPDIGSSDQYNVDPWGFASTVSSANYDSARSLSNSSILNIVYAEDLGNYYEREFKKILIEPDDCDDGVRNQIQLIIDSGNAVELIDFLKKMGKTPIFQVDQEKKASLDGVYLEAKKKQFDC